MMNEAPIAVGAGAAALGYAGYMGYPRFARTTRLTETTAGVPTPFAACRLNVLVPTVAGVPDDPTQLRPGCERGRSSYRAIRTSTI